MWRRLLVTQTWTVIYQPFAIKKRCHTALNSCVIVTWIKLCTCTHNDTAARLSMKLRFGTCWFRISFWHIRVVHWWRLHGYLFTWIIPSQANKRRNYGYCSKLHRLCGEHKSDGGRRCLSDGVLAISVPKDELTARAHYSIDSNLLLIYYFVTFVLR